MKKSSAEAYCKQIIRDLKRIPIYPPSVERKLGDIIQYRDRVVKTKPIGSHTLISNLSKLDIEMSVREDKNPAPFKYSTKGATSVSFDTEAGTTSKKTGRLTVNFKKQFSTFLIAIDCVTHSFDNLIDLNEKLEPHKDHSGIDWENCFIVNSITIAKKAFILQVSEKDSVLELEGDVSGLNPANKISPIDASLKFNINKMTSSELLIDRAENINIFFGLLRYKKTNEGMEYEPVKNRFLLSKDMEGLDIKYEIEHIVPAEYEFIN